MFNEKTVLSQWIADMYDIFETETEDAAFALSLLGDRPQRVLEIACGSGRLLLPFARAGHDVTGLDFDPYMLAKLSAKAGDMKNVRWRQADAIRDNWGSGYNAVILAGNFLFNIVSDMDYAQCQQLVIQKAAGALAAGGHLYIDYGYTPHPENWFNAPSDHVVWEGTDSCGNTGRMMLCGGSFDQATGMYQSVRRFELSCAGGEELVQELPCVKHFATLSQIHDWLRQAGFAVEAEYGGYDRRLIDDTTSRALIWAQKC